MSSNLTPRRPASSRPRALLSNSGINTASTPNLGASFKTSQSPAVAHLRSAAAAAVASANSALDRKASLSSLTSGSLAAIPDASEGYALSTVLDDDDEERLDSSSSPSSAAYYKMVSNPQTATTSRRQDSGNGEIEVGDLVDVQGNMHGVVRFVGAVQGKNGVFAGVELSQEFAPRGKNSGDVDGISYFTTSTPGSGIFLPTNRATRRTSASSRASMGSLFPLTPTTPSHGNARSINNNSNNSLGQDAPPTGYTPPTPSLPKFSQSVGPGLGRAPSPQMKKSSRPSLPRPESPSRILRQQQTGTPLGRPSLGGGGGGLAGGVARYAPSPTPGKFAQSARGGGGVTQQQQQQDARDPSKRAPFTPRPSGMMMMRGSMGHLPARSSSALGGGPQQGSVSFSDDDETTPIGVARTTDHANTNKNNSSKSHGGSNAGSVSSFGSKLLRPASVAAGGGPPAAAAAAAMDGGEVERLRAELADRDRQLREQAASLGDMESSLTELQGLMEASSPSETGRLGRGSGSGRAGTVAGAGAGWAPAGEERDATQLRALLREKNEKIGMLTAEFDAHRADFRSTIDTLEMASTETERVYERRVEELTQELRELHERGGGGGGSNDGVDVDSVARQLRQLEELVQELEEGLEDARRGEAEARGEVEFLRGEVERGRSELKREREKAAAAAAAAATAAASSTAAATTQAGTNGDSNNNNIINNNAHSRDVEQRDDEIRGLKAIIHSLSRDSVPEQQHTHGSAAAATRTPTRHSGGFPRHSNQLQGAEPAGDGGGPAVRERLEREVRELQALVDRKSGREEELERELERLRRRSGGAGGAGPGQRASAMTVGSNGTVTQQQQQLERTSARDSRGTVVSWRENPRSPRGAAAEAQQQQQQSHRRNNTLESMPESDDYSSAAESTGLWCEICETSGHDILTCTNMFGSFQQQKGEGKPQKGSGGGGGAGGKGDASLKGLSQQPAAGADDEFRPAPLLHGKKAAASVAPPAAAVSIMPNPMESGPVAGKKSGVVDTSKWCAVCERDGHESVDCPFEDAF